MQEHITQKQRKKVKQIMRSSVPSLLLLFVMLAACLASCGYNEAEEAAPAAEAEEEVVQQVTEPTPEQKQHMREDEEVWIEEEKVGSYCVLGATNAGLVLVYSNEDKTYGLMNENGELLIPCDYDYMVCESCFSADPAKKDGEEEERIDRIIVKKDGKYGLLAEDGEEILPCEYALIVEFTLDYVDPEKYCWTEDMERIRLARKNEGDKLGYITLTDGSPVSRLPEPEPEESSGEEDTDAETTEDRIKRMKEQHGYYSLDPMIKGTYRAQKKKGDLYKIIDEDGKPINDFQYTEVRREGAGRYTYHTLRDNLLVRDRGSRWGIVDKDGRQIAPCGSYTAVEELSSTLFAVQTEEGGLFALARVIDGEVVILTDFIFNTEHKTC